MQPIYGSVVLCYTPILSRGRLLNRRLIKPLTHIKVAGVVIVEELEGPRQFGFLRVAGGDVHGSETINVSMRQCSQ